MIYSLERFMPVMHIEDDIVVSKRGDLTVGWRLHLPVSYTVNEAGYDSIIISFLKAYRLLPPYCIVHKQDVFREDVYAGQRSDYFLQNASERHFDGRRYLNGYCNLYLIFSSKGAVESNSMNMGGGGGMFKVRLPGAADVERALSVASQFAAVLSNNPLIRMERMGNGDFLRVGPHGEDLGVLSDLLNLYSHRPGLVMPPDCFADRVEVGDLEARCWYVEDSDAYPGTVGSVVPVSSVLDGGASVYLSGGSPIGYQLQIPHVVNRYVVTLPDKVVESELSQRKRLMTSFSLYSASCRVNSAELEAYQTVAANSGLTTTKCFTSVIAWDRTDRMGDVRDSIITAFSALDVSVCEETLSAPALFRASVPGGESELPYDYLMNSEMTAFLCHGLWDGYDPGVKGGHIKLCDRKRMVPISLDIQSVARLKGLIANMNALVVGPSGSGKSFTMNTLLRNFYDSQDHIFVIDVGDSYQGLCGIINEQTGGRDGIYNTYDPANPFSFNPFLGRKHWNECDSDGESASSGNDFIMSLIQTMFEPDGGWSKQLVGLLTSFLQDFFRLWDNGPDDELEQSLVSAFINSSRARAERTGSIFDEEKCLAGWTDPLKRYFSEETRRREPVFDDFYQYIRVIVNPLVLDGSYTHDGVPVTTDMLDISSFAISLSKYSRKGEYGYLLNAEEQKDFFASRFTVFEVDMIKDNEDLFPLWILCIMHSFEDKMRTLPCQKVIVIEEAWSAVAKPSMARFLTWMWRTARKFQTSAVVVTQSLGDLLASPIIKDAIVHNSDVKILLSNSMNASNCVEYSSILGLDSMSVALALSVGKNLNPAFNYREVFISLGDNFSNVFALEVSPEEALVYESDKVKKRPLFELAVERGSMREAVTEMARKIKDK